MPIYEYHCPACDHDFEQLVRSARAGRQVTCPACGASKVERRLSVFAARQEDGSRSAAPVPEACQRCGQQGGPCPMQS